MVRRYDGKAHIITCHADSYAIAKINHCRTRLTKCVRGAQLQNFIAAPDINLVLTRLRSRAATSRWRIYAGWALIYYTIVWARVQKNHFFGSVASTTQKFHPILYIAIEQHVSHHPVNFSYFFDFSLRVRKTSEIDMHICKFWSHTPQRPSDFCDRSKIDQILALIHWQFNRPLFIFCTVVALASALASAGQREQTKGSTLPAHGNCIHQIIRRSSCHSVAKNIHRL
jgi:hypothetical protein